MPFYPVLYTFLSPFMSYKNKQRNTTQYKKQTNNHYIIQNLLHHTNKQILHLTKNNKRPTPHTYQNKIIPNARNRFDVPSAPLPSLLIRHASQRSRHTLLCGGACIFTFREIKKVLEIVQIQNLLSLQQRRIRLDAL